MVGAPEALSVFCELSYNFSANFFLLKSIIITLVSGSHISRALGDDPWAFCDQGRISWHKWGTSSQLPFQRCRPARLFSCHRKSVILKDHWLDTKSSVFGKSGENSTVGNFSGVGWASRVLDWVTSHLILQPSHPQRLFTLCSSVNLVLERVHIVCPLRVFGSECAWHAHLYR